MGLVAAARGRRGCRWPRAAPARSGPLRGPLRRRRPWAPGWQDRWAARDARRRRFGHGWESPSERSRAMSLSWSIVAQTRKCAGSDPPHGRFAVVVANTLPGPKPLPALERSSHPSAFRSSDTRTVVAYGSLHTSSRAALPYSATARHHVGHRVVQEGQCPQRAKQSVKRGYPRIVVRPGTVVDNRPVIGG